jgi:hypothetical protein
MPVGPLPDCREVGDRALVAPWPTYDVDCRAAAEATAKRNNGQWEERMYEHP